MSLRTKLNINMKILESEEVSISLYLSRDNETNNYSIRTPRRQILNKAFDVRLVLK